MLRRFTKLTARTRGRISRISAWCSASQGSELAELTSFGHTVGARVTVTRAEATFEARSRARTSIDELPVGTVTSQAKLPGLSAARTPLQATSSTWASASETRPSTRTREDGTAPPSGGVSITRSGGVRSRLTVTAAVAVLPALSRAVPETGWSAPSTATTTEGGQNATPDSPSSHPKATTSSRCQPRSFGGGWITARIRGGVVSRQSRASDSSSRWTLSSPVETSSIQWLPAARSTPRGGLSSHRSEFTRSRSGKSKAWPSTTRRSDSSGCPGVPTRYLKRSAWRPAAGVSRRTPSRPQPPAT
jgi:hypothetical protein